MFCLWPRIKEYSRSGSVDAVLVQKGREHLVENGRQISTSSGGIKKLGKVVTRPLNRFSKEGLLRYIVSLPLNSLPVVGTVLFLLYNGTQVGWVVNESIC